MKGCTYVGALSTGHICYPPTPLAAGSPNVRVNFIMAGRVGELLTPHACPCANCPPPHAGRPISQGPINVYFNFRPPGRIGDMICCVDSIAQGSFNVFAGTF